MDTQELEQLSVPLNLIVRDFHLTDHLSEIKSWLRMRNQNEEIADEIPSIGKIAFHGDEAIAAAFLRRAENYHAIFDGLITKPTVDSHLRNQALDLVVKALIEQAKKLRIKLIVAWTTDKGTLERSARHGFRQLPDTMITLDLS